jgi:hypothetical protein
MPTRISKIDSEFSGYIISSTTYLLDEPTPGSPNWQRLGLTLAEKDEWVAMTGRIYILNMPTRGSALFLSS